MVLLILLAATMVSPPPAEDAPISAEQFARIMTGLHAGFEDISFVFEGRVRGVPPGRTVEQLLAGADPDAPHLDFQGQYIFRSDGATRLDRFDSSTFATAPGEAHHISAMLPWRLERVSRLPTNPDLQPVSSPGGPGSLNEPGSPERILYLWYFQGVEVRVKNGYKFLGWEDVDGHHCAKVELAQPAPTEAHPDGRLGERLWIDLERGGHPLRVEYFDPKGICMRVQGIRLAQLDKPDGNRVWLPVQGYCETLATASPHHSTKPVGLETYDVVEGTVRLNQGLPDEVFRLDWKGTLPETKSLATQRRGFRQRRPRRDPEGIREELKHQLALAEARSQPVEAETPEQRQAHQTLTIQVGLAATGVALLGGAAWWWRRRR